VKIGLRLGRWLQHAGSLTRVVQPVRLKPSALTIRRKRISISA
jgi:hypothetical protein